MVSASKALHSATLRCQDFRDTLGEVKSDEDIVYIDPPYTVKHDSNGFRRYNDNIFTNLYDKIHGEFPAVLFVDHIGLCCHSARATRTTSHNRENWALKNDFRRLSNDTRHCRTFLLHCWTDPCRNLVALTTAVKLLPLATSDLRACSRSGQLSVEIGEKGPIVRMPG